MSDLEKRDIVKAIDHMTEEQKLMTLGFVKGMSAASAADKADEKKEAADA